MEASRRYPAVVFGVQCASNEDVQAATRARRDDPDRDRTPRRYTITSVETVEIDPMWLDEQGRVAWRASPTEVGGEMPIPEEFRRTPEQFLETARRIAGSTFKPVAFKRTVKGR